MDVVFSLTIPIKELDYISNYDILKKDIIKKIICLSDMPTDNDNYKKYIKIIINNQLNIVFINFIDKELAINFCKSFKDKSNKIDICENEFKIKPNYKYFSKIIIEEI